MWQWFRRLISRNISTSLDEERIQEALGIYKRYDMYLYSRRGDLSNGLSPLVEMSIIAATKGGAVTQLMRRSKDAREYCTHIFDSLVDPENQFNNARVQTMEWATTTIDKTVCTRLVIMESE